MTNRNHGTVQGICIAGAAGATMQLISKVEAIAGRGLRGDRYSTGEGSFNNGKMGNRQVTLINALFLPRSGFEFHETRRNLLVEGVELMWLIGREFEIGQALMRGVKYCDPCLRPGELEGKEESFREKFFDRGGLVAEVLRDGVIKVGDPIIPPPKGY